MKISNKTYDLLKYVALIFIPALVAFVTTAGTELGYPHTETLTVLISAFGTFLGALLVVSSNIYNKGVNDGQENQ